jgi:hypothetical protein
LRRRADTLLELIITGNKSLHDIIKSIDDFLIGQNEVANFDLSDTSNSIRKMELGFYNLISSLESNGVTNAKDLTVFELYQRIDYYEEVNRKHRNKQNNS